SRRGCRQGAGRGSMPRSKPPTWRRWAARRCRASVSSRRRGDWSRPLATRAPGRRTSGCAPCICWAAPDRSPSGDCPAPSAPFCIRPRRRVRMACFFRGRRRIPQTTGNRTNGERRRHRIRRHDLRNPPEHHVPGAARDRPRDHCAHLRTHAQELHPHPDRLPGQGRDDALRPHQGSQHLPHEVGPACRARSSAGAAPRFPPEIRTTRIDAPAISPVAGPAACAYAPDTLSGEPPMHRPALVRALVLSIALAMAAPVAFAHEQAPAAEAAQSESRRLNAWFADKYERQLQFSPIALTFLGRKELYDQLDDMSEQARDAQLAWHKATVAEMEANFDRDALDDEARLSWDLWKLQYENAAAANAYRRNVYVFNQMQGAQSFLPTFLINFHKVDTEADYQAYIARL